MVEIPYWWKGNEGSLAATIHSIRPELVPPLNVDPISLTPVEKGTFPLQILTFVAQNTPLLAHGQPWDGSQDLTGWWISEKMDGIRAYWNRSELLSRHGTRINAPQWFITRLPNMSVDGELWDGERNL